MYPLKSRKNRNEPLVTVVIPQLKAHFCSLLISNIFCNPLFLFSPSCLFHIILKTQITFLTFLRRIPSFCFYATPTKGDALTFLCQGFYSRSQALPDKRIFIIHSPNSLTSDVLLRQLNFCCTPIYMKRNTAVSVFFKKLPNHTRLGYLRNSFPRLFSHIPWSESLKISFPSVCTFLSSLVL